MTAPATTPIVRLKYELPLGKVRAIPYSEGVKHRPSQRSIARMLGRLAAVGLALRDTIELGVPGRRTGWARKVRAADYRVTIRHRRAHRVRLEEVPV